MEKTFRFLKTLAILFKAFAVGALFLMGVGITGLIVGRNQSPIPILPAILNVLVFFLLAACVLAALAEIIRVLLLIEARTRKE